MSEIILMKRTDFLLSRMISSEQTYMRYDRNKLKSFGIVTKRPMHTAILID